MNTVYSYQDSMMLFLTFMCNVYHIGTDRLDFKDITQECVRAYSMRLKQTARIVYRAEIHDCHHCIPFFASCCIVFRSFYMSDIRYS